MSQQPGRGTEERRDGRRSGVRGTARAKLLDAAERVFAERGYRGASVDDIAAEAGLTKGALYWSFAGKQELLFALVDERLDHRIRALMRLTETADKAAETAGPVGRAVTNVVDEQRQLFLLMNELWSIAVREPELHDAYVARQRALRADLARAIAARHETTGVELTIDAGRLATAILALANGLALDRIADPEAVPEELLGEVLSLIYDGLTVRAGAAPTS